MPTDVSTTKLGSIGENVVNVNAKASNTPLTEMVDTVDSTVTLDAVGSCQIAVTGLSGSRGLYWNRTGAYDNKSCQRLVWVAYNPSDRNVYNNQNIRVSDGTNAREHGTRLLPGWNIIPIDTLETGAAGGAYQHSALTRYTKQCYTAQSSFTYGKFATVTWNEVGLWKAPSGRPVLIIGFDDAFYTMYQYAWPVIQKTRFAHLKFCVNVVGGYTEAGVRTNLSPEPICSVANLDTLYSSGQFEFCNHTYNHYPLESGHPVGSYAVNGTRPSAPSTEWMFGLSGSSTVLTLEGVDTAAIAAGATGYTVQNAIDTAWGAGVCTVGGSMGSLSATNGFRLTFSSAVEITATGGTGIYCVPAFTVEEIRAEYADNAEWMASNGWAAGSRMAIGPIGHWGVNVFEGLRKAGMETFRFMSEAHASSMRGLTLHAQAKLNPYTQGAILFDPATTGYKFADVVTAIRKAQAFGGLVNVFFHGFANGASSGSNVGSTEFETFLDFVLQEQTAGRLQTMWPSQYWEAL